MPIRISAAILSLALVPSAFAAEFYVSPGGSDASSGAKTAPFATLSRARDAVRQIKSQGLKEPITVIVRGGKHFLDDTLRLTAEDSGRNNVIENNVLVGCAALMRYQEVCRTFGPGYISSNHFQRNILYGTEPSTFIFFLHAWADRAVAKSDENVFFHTAGQYAVTWHGGEGEPIRSLEQWKKRGYDAHSVIADPLFVDPEHDDYRLQLESPALKLGFQPIDPSRIGRRARD